jgi:DNA-binding NarL/FixJ family response regulator
MASADAYGLLLSDDLMFSSRITGTAQVLGLKMDVLKSTKELMARLKEQMPTCMILDLGHPELQIQEFISELRDACSPMPRLVAYGSHVDAAVLRGAREAGCDVVLPRSAFIEQLPGNLGRWLSRSG